MLKSKTFLCLDFGAGTLKAAEFEQTDASTLCLKNFGVKALGLAGSQDSAREGVVQRALQELITERGFTAKVAYASAPGYQVFSKYVKLPPVDSSKVTQIIQYEAQQNVPFPLEEVVWNYQVTGNLPSGELEVFLVAIKSEIVEGLFRMCDNAGLRLQLVDVAPAALCNSFRYNYGDPDGCSMLLDIGAKTSNVLFFEKGKSSSRGVNIGANSITQDFANEARMPFIKAEQFKIAEGFVSLGGAYEEPENPQQAQIAKVARQVMTRLHIQVNQTMQFYRGQQGGGAPQRLFMAGGASVMPYTSQFFQEKLNVQVEYYNPLRNIQIDAAVNLEELAKVAHSLGEVVGLGLRSIAQCPIELNLIPKSILQRQQFNAKKPYFIATAVSLVCALLAIGWFYDAKVVTAKKDNAAKIQSEANPLKQIWEGQLDNEMQSIERIKKDSEKVSLWLSNRVFWIEVLKELRSCLQTTEAGVESLPDLKAKNIASGVWINKLTPDVPGANDQVEVTAQSSGMSRMSPYMMMSPEMMKRYGLMPQMAAAAAAPAAEEPAAAKVNTNEVTTINLTCTAVNLKRFSDAANEVLINEFKAQLLSRTNWFAPDTTLGKTFTNPDPNDDTFSFDVVLKLKQPIKL